MKKILINILCAVCALAVTVSCYDDAEIKSTIDDLDSRLSKVEEQVRAWNNYVADLKDLVHAIDAREYVTDIQSIEEGGKTGWAVYLSKHDAPLKFFNGADGKTGADGKVPDIGVRQDADGQWYWTLGGEFILVEGQKIRASGRDGSDGTPGDDGVTPKFKIEDGNWYVSYDNGGSWSDEPLGVAGNAGIFSDVIADDEKVTFILASGDPDIVIWRKARFTLALSLGECFVDKGAVGVVDYTVSGAEEGADVMVYAFYKPQDWNVKVTAIDASAGSVEISAPAVIGREVIVLQALNNTTGEICSKGLRVSNGKFEVDNGAVAAEAQGGVYSIRLTTNIEPELCTYTSSASWVTVAPATRSVRTDELAITVAENTAAARSATLTISCEGIMDDIEVSIAQEAPATCPSVNGICFDECSYEGFLKAEAKFTTGQKAVFTNIGNIEEKLQPSFWAVAGEDVVFNALSADVVLYMKISDGLIYTEYPETAGFPDALWMRGAGQYGHPGAAGELIALDATGTTPEHRICLARIADGKFKAVACVDFSKDQIFKLYGSVHGDTEQYNGTGKNDGEKCDLYKNGEKATWDWEWFTQPGNPKAKGFMTLFFDTEEKRLDFTAMDCMWPDSPVVDGIKMMPTRYVDYMSAYLHLTGGQSVQFSGVADLEKALQTHFWTVSGNSAVFNGREGDYVLHYNKNTGLVYTELNELAPANANEASWATAQAEYAGKMPTYWIGGGGGFGHNACGGSDLAPSDWERTFPDKRICCVMTDDGVYEADIWLGAAAKFRFYTSAHGWKNFTVDVSGTIENDMWGLCRVWDNGEDATRGDDLNFALPANGEAGLYHLILDTNPVDPAKVGTDRRNYKVTYTKK